jgi:hypothetical protein
VPPPVVDDDDDDHREVGRDRFFWGTDGDIDNVDEEDVGTRLSSSWSLIITAEWTLTSVVDTFKSGSSSLLLAAPPLAFCRRNFINLANSGSMMCGYIRCYKI